MTSTPQPPDDLGLRHIMDDDELHDRLIDAAVDTMWSILTPKIEMIWREGWAAGHAAAMKAIKAAADTALEPAPPKTLRLPAPEVPATAPEPAARPAPLPHQAVTPAAAESVPESPRVEASLSPVYLMEVSDAQRALLTREYPGGIHIRGIFARFNAMPGARVASPADLSQLANKMKLRRPSGYDGNSAPMEMAAEKLPPVPKSPAAPIRMDASQLIHWARQRAIVLHLPIREDDVAECNAKARAIGHPPIEYVGPVA